MADFEILVDDFETFHNFPTYFKLPIVIALFNIQYLIIKVNM